MGVVSMATYAIGHHSLRSKCRSLSIPIHFGIAIEPGILTTSMSMWISGLLMTGSSWAAIVLLSRQPSGLSELGLYNAVDKWRVAMQFLPSMLFQVTLPMLSHSHAAGDNRSCGRIIRAALASTVAITGAAAVVVFAFSRFLMLSYGSGFLAGTRVLSLAALGAVFIAIYTVASGALWALGKPSQMLSVDFAKTVLFLAMCWFGLASSAWNLMMAYLLSFAVGCIIVMLAIRIELRTQKAEEV
jgi:O-antigen/teichoic acid export membrane protein